MVNADEKNGKVLNGLKKIGLNQMRVFLLQCRIISIQIPEKLEHCIELSSSAERQIFRKQPHFNHIVEQTRKFQEKRA